MKVYDDTVKPQSIRIVRPPECCGEWDRSIQMDIVVARVDGSVMPVCPQFVSRLRSKGWTGLEQIPPACFGRI